MNSLRSSGILTQVHYIPIYKQPYYKDNYPHNEDDYPNCEAYYKETISIPMFPKMKNRDIDKVVNLIKEVLTK